MKIIVIGDSISFGLYDKHGGWAKRLFQPAPDKNNANDFKNLSRPGATSKQVLLELKNALKTDVLNNECKVFFAYGINDSAIKDGVEVIPFSEFEENTKKIISIIQKHQMKMCFVGLTIVNEAVADNFIKGLHFSNERIKSYNDTLKRICSEFAIDFIDLNNECNNHTEFIDMLHDGLHPDENGHGFIMVKIIKLSQ